MISGLLISFCASFLAGLGYAALAFRLNRLLFSGAVRASGGARFGILSVRLLLLACAIAALLYADLGAPLWIVGGTVCGYVLFYAFYAVTAWM